jgi:hypothetical protein
MAPAVPAARLRWRNDGKMCPMKTYAAHTRTLEDFEHVEREALARSAVSFARLVNPANMDNLSLAEKQHVADVLNGH